MPLSNLFKSTRLFLYLGLGLILLALVCFPAKVRVVSQPGTPETDTMWLGPIFTILIGAWSLPSLLLGVIESSTSKKAVLLGLTPILCLGNIALALSLWDAIRFWRGMLIQWLLVYSPLLVPCAIADVTTFLYFTKEETLAKALKNPITRFLSMIILVAIPLIFATTLLHMWLATIIYQYTFCLP